MKSFNRAAQGFAIITAIFILVVLAVLGSFIVNVSTSQHIGSAIDVQGVRAYQAARAGIEWGLYQVQSSSNYNFSYGNPATTVGVANPNLRTCPVSPSPIVPAATTLAGFTVTVRCLETPDGANGPTIYSITSTACNQPNAGECPNTTNPSGLYIERRLDVTF
jgi:MSHA biogenesis protein MshP